MLERRWCQPDAPGRRECVARRLMGLLSNQRGVSQPGQGAASNLIGKAHIAETRPAKLGWKGTLSRLRIPA